MENKKLKTLLKNAGYKVTKPRLLVLSFLSKTKNPVSAKEIIQNLRLDQVTVYRTLEALKKECIVSQIDFKENSAYFELKDEKKDHHHIVCTQCKKVEDFIGCDYKKIANITLKKTRDFAKITNHSFEFFGVCKSCT